MDIHVSGVFGWIVFSCLAIILVTICLAAAIAALFALYEYACNKWYSFRIGLGAHKDLAFFINNKEAIIELRKKAILRNEK